jgi:hypothetical protein
LVLAVAVSPDISLCPLLGVKRTFETRNRSCGGPI